MNLIKQRELEIEEVEGNIICLKNQIEIANLNKWKENSKDLMNELAIYLAKRKTLKKILLEEKEFVKRLKKAIKLEIHNLKVLKFITRKIYTDLRTIINDKFDNISINSPQDNTISSSSYGNRDATSYGSHEGVRISNLADNELEDNIESRKNAVGSSETSGSSNLCKCGHIKERHNLNGDSEFWNEFTNEYDYCMNFESQGEGA